MLVRQRRLGVPKDARDSFSLIERAMLISTEMSQRLQGMIGFRNIAVHQYQDLDVAIVESVIRDRLDDLLRLAEIVRVRLVEADG